MFIIGIRSVYAQTSHTFFCTPGRGDIRRITPRYENPPSNFRCFFKIREKTQRDRPPVPIEQAESNGPGCWSVEAVALPGPWIAIQCGIWRRMALFSRTCSIRYYTDQLWHIATNRRRKECFLITAIKKKLVWERDFVVRQLKLVFNHDDSVTKLEKFIIYLIVFKLRLIIYLYIYFQQVCITKN